MPLFPLDEIRMRSNQGNQDTPRCLLEVLLAARAWRHRRIGRRQSWMSSRQPQGRVAGKTGAITDGWRIGGTLHPGSLTIGIGFDGGKDSELRE